jgi:hypothetical protein
MLGQQYRYAPLAPTPDLALKVEEDQDGASQGSSAGAWPPARAPRPQSLWACLKQDKVQGLWWAAELVVVTVGSVGTNVVLHNKVRRDAFACVQSAMCVYVEAGAVAFHALPLQVVGACSLPCPPPPTHTHPDPTLTIALQTCNALFRCGCTWDWDGGWDK